MLGDYVDRLQQYPSFTLADAVSEACGDFEDAFFEYWGVNAKVLPDTLSHDDWLEAKRLYGLAQQIASLGATLVHRKGIGPERLAEPGALAAEVARYEASLLQFAEHAKRLLPDLTDFDLMRLQSHMRSIPGGPVAKLGIVTGALQIYAAALFPWNPAVLADRLQRLTEFLVRHPGDRTRDYLSRVATCYVLDLKPEFAVMARAALDAALEGVIDDDAVRARLRGDRVVTLQRRIEYLRSMDLVDSKTLDAAERLRRAGRDAAHFTPSMVPDIDGLLGDLVSVLNALEHFKELERTTDE